MDRWSDSLSDLYASLDRAELESLSDMLLSVGRSCGGFGCTLWQLRGGPEPSQKLPTKDDLASLPATASLYVLAHGFEGKYHCFFHDLPLHCASGRAVLSPTGIYEVRDAESDSSVDRTTAFYKDAKPGSMLVRRILFTDGTVGALTLYRTQRGAFDPDLTKLFCFLADHVARLYQTIRDRVSYRLVETVSAEITLIEETEALPIRSAGEQPLRDAMQRICDSIAKGLRCVEVSLFLEDRLALPGVYGLYATTSPALCAVTEYRLNEPGLTSYALRTGEALFVLDACHFPPGLRGKSGWNPRYSIEAKVREVLGLREEDELPPVTTAVVPMTIGGKTIGALRCSLCPEPPYFLAEKEMELLRILASPIGSFRSRRLRLQEVRQTEISWRTFVERMNGLNRFSQSLSENSKGRAVTKVFQNTIYKEVLEVLQKSIEGADCLDVALPDTDQRTIGAEVTVGKYWDKPAFNLKATRAQVRLPLGHDAQNVWSHVFMGKEACYLADTQNPDAPYANLIPETRQALFVPILADGHCLGVISVRSSTSLGDSQKARHMAELVALEIALYHRLTNALSQQSRTYQDMEHQLRSPVFQALKRVKWLLKRDHDPDIELQAVNGLLSKSRRVLENMRLYEELATEQQVTVHRSEITLEALVKLVAESAYDNQLLWQKRRIRFIVDRSSFAEAMRLSKVVLDTELLEQILNNLLDNAGKYSSKESTITISASFHERKDFVLSVQNQGIPLTAETIERMGIRGFRSEAAKGRTAEGSGAGLYIVRRIMEAHAGSFGAELTDSAGYNRVWVAFPQKQV